jgi:hypothetical protein
MIRDGADNTRQLDWGAVGVIFKKQQLIDFIGSLDCCEIAHIKESVDEAVKFVNGLDGDVDYVLTAYETGEDNSDW